MTRPASNPDLAIVVLAAGEGTRMRSSLPKVMHRLAGRSMLGHVLATCETLGPGRVVVVAGPDMAAVEATAKPYSVAIQSERRGTGHAVMAAGPALEGFKAETILVIYGDTPLLKPETLAAMVAERREAEAAVVVLGMRVTGENAYGRLILDPDGGLARIVEARDCSPEERAVDLCNSGVMAVDGAALPRLLRGLTNENAKGEYYLTDIVALARAEARPCRVVEAPVSELAGVNSRVDLAEAEAILQDRLRHAALLHGVTMTDPGSVFLAWDTALGRDVTIGPNVVFGPGVSVADGVEIRAFSHIEGAEIGPGAVIGPFARLRPGTRLHEGVHIGNFVETKNTVLGPGAKANHLTYLGDAVIGAGSNVGAGTITCNYDGFAKHRTTIGSGVFIGSNTSLVAPVTVGDRAMVAAGSVITRDVAPDATAIARGRQADLPGHAARFRAARPQKES